MGWQTAGFYPACASQVLHDLSLTGIRRFHFFADSDFDKLGRTA